MLEHCKSQMFISARVLILAKHYLIYALCTLLPYLNFQTAACTQTNITQLFFIQIKSDRHFL